MMSIVVIASKNPVKEQATRLGFQMIFPQEEFEFLSLNVSSGVSEQPRSDQVTLNGAENRAKNARLQCPEAGFWVGIEGGVEELDEGMMAFAWVVIVTPNGKGIAKSGSFQLPPRVAALISEGKELGEVDDLIFGIKNSKISLGAIGILTESKITRAGYYAHAVSLALIPISNQELYR